MRPNLGIHGGKVELWDLHPSDEAPLWDSDMWDGSNWFPITRLIEQSPIELPIPLGLTQPRIQPRRPAISENQKPGRKQKSL